MTSSPTTPPATGSPSSSTPSPAPTPGVSSPPLRVSRPETASPIPSVTTARTGTDYGTGSAPDPLADSAAPTGTPSSASKNAGPLSAASLRELARGMVLGATRYVHELLARTEDERAAELWVANEDEQQQMGDPLASLASRHARIAGVNPDVADLITLGVAATSWAARNIAAAWNLRRARRKLATATNEPLDAQTGEPA